MFLFPQRVVGFQYLPLAGHCNPKSSLSGYMAATQLLYGRVSIQSLLPLSVIHVE